MKGSKENTQFVRKVPWSSGYGKRVALKRSLVRIPAKEGLVKDI